MKWCVVVLEAALILWHATALAGRPVSTQTQACLHCHRNVTAGIVADWQHSRMARVTPAAARSMVVRKRRVSFQAVPGDLARVTVGCAECHTMSPETHADSFDHNGFQVHVVVTPQDCALCHPVERTQYTHNLMSHAYGNLQDNPVYRNLVDSTNAVQRFEGANTVAGPADQDTDAESCFYCHGTQVRLRGTQALQTPYGTMNFPVLTGWPNQGVGRINPDQSKGSCTACHTRHRFSIEMARKPATCSECHKGPDVPGYKVYQVSKHGNIYAALAKSWNFKAVPWTIGKDFGAPTCAVCHVSLVISETGDLIAERTHQMSDRIAWRIMGLIYAHPQPKLPDTTVIRNADGLPLPTTLTGRPAARFLIDKTQQQRRQARMRDICLACHTRSWVAGQRARFEHTIRTTNQMTLAATEILMSAWEKGLAKGPAQKDSPFNEAIEKKWVEQWLFFANTTRYASAMMGADYGAFANGRWQLSRNVEEMAAWLRDQLDREHEEH